MKLYAPKYYKNFKCIADKCTHSCCIGWEIDVDKETMKRYSKLKNGYGKEIKNSIERKDTPHFKLKENDKCPHLDNNGLCKIIINCGEDYLCSICREHPRFYNYTNYGKEVGLGMSCQEACRIILSSRDYDKMIEIQNINEEIDIIDFDAIPHRKKLYSILKNDEFSYTQKLEAIYNEYEISPSIINDDRWRKCLSDLEYLDTNHKKLFLNYSSKIDDTYRLENILAYLIYRHCTEAINKKEHLVCLCLCLFLERLLASMLENNRDYDIIEMARILSEEIEYSTDNIDAIKALIEEAI